MRPDLSGGTRPYWWPGLIYWSLLFFLPLSGTAAIALYGWEVHSLRLALIEAFIAWSSLLAGYLLGFLFGIPRTLQSDAPPRTSTQEVSQADASSPSLNLDYRFNTNLEQISDWLTKIIVGVGLVQLPKIADGLRSMGEAVSANLRPELVGSTKLPVEGVVPLTVSAVAFFVVSGFLGSYLWTRLEYGGLLAASDRSTLRRLSEKIEEGAELARSAERIASAASFARGEASSSKRQFGGTPSVQFVPPPNWPPDVVKKVQHFQQLDPVWDEDPAASIFPGAPSMANGWRLSAQVRPVAGAVHVVTLNLDADKNVSLPQVAVFLLHPTYTQRVVKVTVSESHTELSIPAEGAFTVVAIVDDGKTILSLNLATAPGATAEFVNG